MLIISTSPVAEIIHAVSAASILAGAAAACASAGVTAIAISMAAQVDAPARASVPLIIISPRRLVILQRVVVGLAGADAHRAIEVVNEDFSVADLAGLGGVADRGDDPLLKAVLDPDLDLELGQEVHGVFGAAIDFGVALLAAEALDLGHGHAVDAERLQRVADLVELEGFDDGDHELHGGEPPVGVWERKSPIDNENPPRLVWRRADMPTISARRAEIKRIYCLTRRQKHRRRAIRLVSLACQPCLGSARLGRIRPSWATEATRVPSAAKIRPRPKPL